MDDRSVRVEVRPRSRLAPAQLFEVAAFAAGRNRDPGQHIGYVGETPEQVASEFRELEGDPLVATAHAGGRLAGLLVADFDVDIGRTWLNGPWADPADLMDRLYHAVAPRLPAGAQPHELFCDAANTAVVDFAGRHGFDSHGWHVIMRFAREQLARLAPVSLPRLSPPLHEQFAALHDRAFPGTYAPARVLLADPPTILVATDGDRLLGYVVLKLRPEHAEAQVEYLAVDESARRRGVGGRLLAAALHEAFRDPRYEVMDLVTGDPVARRLYERAGFTLLREMRSFRTVAVAEPPATAAGC